MRTCSRKSTRRRSTPDDRPGPAQLGLNATLFATNINCQPQLFGAGMCHLLGPIHIGIPVFLLRCNHRNTKSRAQALGNTPVFPVRCRLAARRSPRHAHQCPRPSSAYTLPPNANKATSTGFRRLTPVCRAAISAAVRQQPPSAKSTTELQKEAETRPLQFRWSARSRSMNDSLRNLGIGAVRAVFVSLLMVRNYQTFGDRSSRDPGTPATLLRIVTMLFITRTR